MQASEILNAFAMVESLHMSLTEILGENYKEYHVYMLACRKYQNMYARRWQESRG